MRAIIFPKLTPVMRMKLIVLAIAFVLLAANASLLISFLQVAQQMEQREGEAQSAVRALVAARQPLETGDLQRQLADAESQLAAARALIPKDIPGPALIDLIVIAAFESGCASFRWNLSPRWWNLWERANTRSPVTTWPFGAITCL